MPTPRQLESNLRFDPSQTQLNLEEETSSALPDVDTPWQIQTIGSPEKEENGIYVITFPTDKASLMALIPKYAELIKIRLNAGHDTFYVVQSPYGSIQLSTLISMYTSASEHLPYIRSVSAVDTSRMEGGLFLPVIQASLYILRQMMETDVRIFSSQYEAVNWIKSQQK